MKHVQENLLEYKNSKFFNSLFEEDNLSPAEKKKLKDQIEKQGLSVVKKCKNNFTDFKKFAGNIWQEYRDFWKEQEVAAETIEQEGLYYNLFKSNYIVGVVKNPAGQAELTVFNTSANGKDDYIVFKTKNKTAIIDFADFVNNELKSTMKQIIEKQKQAMKAKKEAEKQKEKEESQNKKKEKLQAFLGESEKIIAKEETIYEEDEEDFFCLSCGKELDHGVFPQLCDKCKNDKKSPMKRKPSSQFGHKPTGH